MVVLHHDRLAAYQPLAPTVLELDVALQVPVDSTLPSMSPRGPVSWAVPPPSSTAFEDFVVAGVSQSAGWGQCSFLWVYCIVGVVHRVLRVMHCYSVGITPYVHLWHFRDNTITVSHKTINVPVGACARQISGDVCGKRTFCDPHQSDFLLT